MNERDDLADAERAERAGDPIGAALALRRHLERHAGDGAARLRFARVLIAAGEHAAARQALAPLEAQLEHAWRRQGGEPSPGCRASATWSARSPSSTRWTALSPSAAGRWERLLADDIDDAQARARLARLRPTAPSPLRRETTARGPPRRWSRPKGSRPCAIAWCASSAAARPRRSTWRGTRRSICRSRSRSCTRSWPGRVAPSRSGGSWLARGSWPGCGTRAWWRSTTSTSRRARWPWNGSPAARCGRVSATTRTGSRPPRWPRPRTASSPPWRSCTHRESSTATSSRRTSSCGRPGEVVLADFGAAVQLDREADGCAPRRGGRHAPLPGAGAVSGSARLGRDRPLRGGRDPLGGRHRAPAPEPRGPPPAWSAGRHRRRHAAGGGPAPERTDARPVASPRPRLGRDYFGSS